MNTILCPHCKKEVEITRAFRHQIEEQITRSFESQHKNELEEAVRLAEERAKKKTVEAMHLELKDKENETKEVRQQLQKLQDLLLNMSKKNRELEAKRAEEELAMQKKLTEEMEKLHKEKLLEMTKVREDVQKQITDEYRMKDLEKDKKLQEAQRINDELRRKLEQGSQQTQGEVLELDLEDTLKRSFPEDTIEAVGKGITGADIRHIVKSPRGIICGIILWESKRTKLWSDGWITKLKSDVRSEKAHLPALVSETLPPSCKEGMGFLDGVWICSPKLAVSLAMLLRKCLLDVGYQKAVSGNKTGKAETLYSYVTSHEFQQQVESMVETFSDMQRQLMKEKAVFEKLWSQREAQILRMLKSTANVYGNMQGIAGSAMREIKGMTLDDLTDGEQKRLKLT